MTRSRYTVWLALFMAICICFSGCSANKTADPSSETRQLNVYATFYPIYALADLITEGVADVNLRCLVQPQDGCLRAYQLSDWDLALLTGSADVVFAGGRGLESFAPLLYMLGEDGPVVSELLYNTDLKQISAVNSSEETDPHWFGENPHIYMDVDAAATMTSNIAGVLMLMDPAHEAQYAENLQAAQEKLSKLNAEIDRDLAQVRGEKIIVLNEALTYAYEAYGLNVDLCYKRESGENISGKDLENCLTALKRSDAQVVLLEKQAPASLCEALEAAGYRVALMDVLSTGRAEEGWEGYFRAQKANVQAIIEAFMQAE